MANQNTPPVEGLSPEAAAVIVRMTRKMASSENMDERIRYYDMAKAAEPSVVIPPEVQLEKFKREQRAEHEAREIEARAKETKTRLESQRQALIDSGRYSSETVAKIEKEIMEPRGISDYDVAATLFAAANPPDDPRIPARGEHGSMWGLPWDGVPKEKVSALLQNPRKAALEKANKVMSEIIRDRKRA